MPVLTLHHRVREHMPTGDLSHETNLMTYPDMREDNMAIGPHEVQLHCRPYPSPMDVLLEPTVGSQGCAA